MRSGVFIDVDWTPEPYELAQRVVNVADALESTYLPLAYASQRASADVREHFRTKTGPDGIPWSPWSENYKPVAEAYPNIDVLRRDDILYDAATDDNAFMISGDTLFFNGDDIPEYGWYHQYGASDRKTKQGTHNPLPARPFLGISDETAALIFAAMGDWFDGAIDLFVTDTGKLGRRHSFRDPSAHFPTRFAAKPKP